MVDDDPLPDARPTALTRRTTGEELTVLDGGDRPGAPDRAEGHAMLVTHLGSLPDAAAEERFGPDVQRALYVYYAEGPSLVGAVLDPPLSVHASSAPALEATMRTVVAEHRGVVEADVHPFGRRVERDRALSVISSLVTQR